MVLKNKCHSYRSKSWHVWNHIKKIQEHGTIRETSCWSSWFEQLFLTCFNIDPHICSTPPLDTNITMKKNNTWGPSCEQQQHQVTTTTSTTNIQPQPVPSASHLLRSVELGKGRFKDFFETWPVFNLRHLYLGEPTETRQLSGVSPQVGPRRHEKRPLPLSHKKMRRAKLVSNICLSPTVPAQNWSNLETLKPVFIT